MKLRRKAKMGAKTRSAGDVLVPPEGVPLTFPVAGIGVRMAAQLTDILLTFLTAFALVVALLLLFRGLPFSFLGMLVSLLFFFMRIPYYVLSELAWNGQTIGKRMMKIKVVAHDGGPLTTYALVVRNLMKEAEIFLPGTLVLGLSSNAPIGSLIALAWVIGVLLVPLLNKRRRRLGDIVAGTYVIHLPQPVMLPDIAKMTAKGAPRDGSEFTFQSHQLDHYGAFELQTLEKVLRAFQNNRLRKSARESLFVIVDKIRTKIGYADPIPNDRAEAFLLAFYNAQRAHLEQRQLLGEKRANKHHATEPQNSD